MDITFNRGNENPDGSFSKNFFTIDDPKNKCKEKYFTYKNGVKGHDYVISLNDISDIEYLEFLIKQKYNSI